jgi:dihydrolipoamide dehydrogenase
MSTTQSTQLVVLGAGPGGYAAAFLAADLGMEVVMVDLEPNPGGVCLYRGCIPSKALLHVAKLITESREAAHWGVHFDPPRVDLPRLRAWRDEVVGKLTGGLGELARRRKIQYVQGRGDFEGPNMLAVGGADGSRIAFQHAILATGSSAATLPGIEAGGRIMNSSGALKLEEIPQTLLIVGGGYIGLELGSVYAALGSRVTVVELTGSLLPGADADLVRPLARRLEGAFAAIHLNTKVTSMKETGSGVKVTLDGEGVKDREQTFDRVLVSVGRKPNSANLGIENTRVEVTPQGFVQVDSQLRTAEPSIFAIGDVVGQPMLAHKASHEGRTAVEAIAGRNVEFAPAAIPAVVFTDPEIAWCGLTEMEAKASGLKVEIARFPWAASGRATTLDRSDGVSKLLVDPETERILGVGLCGPGAGELIAEGVLAIEMGATVEDLDLTIHPHPTLSETLMEAAASFFGTSTHVYKPKR